MKNRNTAITVLVIFIVAIVAFSSIIILSIYSYNLQKLVDKQNVTLNNYSKLDSLVTSGQENVVNSINKFFDNTPTYINGEKVSAIDFVAYHERNMDSLRLYRDFYEYSQKHYGIKLKRIEITDSTYRITSNPPTKADSASYLFPEYKHLVSKKGDTWSVVTTDYKKLYEDEVAKYNSLVKDYNEYMRKAIKALESSNKQVDEYNKLLKDLEKDGLIKFDSLGTQ